MNNEKIEQNAERAIQYLKGLGCSKNNIIDIIYEMSYQIETTPKD